MSHVSLPRLFGILMNPDVLIIGVQGLIGSSLSEMAAKHQVGWAGTSRNLPAKGESGIKLDLLNDEEIARLSICPKITYLCAAETNLRKCESNPQETRKINVEQTLKLAGRLHDNGSEIVFLSSNLVFDGSQPRVAPDTPYSPATEYGRQKAEAEKRLLDELERIAIVRLTKVVHPHFPLFQEWLHQLRQKRPIHPFSDRVFSPVDRNTVAEELGALRHSFRRGIFQLSGDVDLSYASAASLLTKCCGIDAGLVKPQTAAQAGFRGHFPAHTTLAHRPVRPQLQPEPSSRVLERTFLSLD